ncbi:hypothetical protein PLICRDRAFT_34283 [Plicaturopsis crispa FD-325 SS-3]|nr:hypothetical protein PLICRDRAFT_34283 [Plicaturopsis crispa FD-325 SS-3]
MLSSALLPVLCALPAFVAAAPPVRATSGCDITQAKPDLPAGQTALVAPSGGPSFIALAIGVQNYTCSNTSTYTNIGAVATLFDASCLYGTPAFDDAQTTAYNAWKQAPPSASPADVEAQLKTTPAVLGYHYYVTNPTTGTGVSPKWDFTSAKFAGNANAFVVGAKAGDIASPAGNASNVDWLSVNPVQGSLASKIFRIDTVNGQPPSSCTQGSPVLSVKYTAKYWLYGGSV